MRRLFDAWLTAVVALAIYGAAGMIGGAIPSNGGWRPPARGVTIWVESNGVHTGIVVPKVVGGVDWRPMLRGDHLRDPRYADYGYASFGWGEAKFYLETPTWADLRPATVAAAAIGSDRTLVHVDHVPAPREGRDVRRIVLREEEYRRLAAFLNDSVAPGGGHRPGYGRNDAFYEARGRYSGIRTCNAWAGEGAAPSRGAGRRVDAVSGDGAGVVLAIRPAVSSAIRASAS